MWMVLFLSLCFILPRLAHGATSKSNRSNSLGVEQTYSNPNTYLLAVPIDAQFLDGGNFTSIRFHPYNTTMLYDENVLFCGDVAEYFNGKRGVLIIVYDRVGHRAFRGLACHELSAVFEVPRRETP